MEAWENSKTNFGNKGDFGNFPREHGSTDPLEGLFTRLKEHSFIFRMPLLQTHLYLLYEFCQQCLYVESRKNSNPPVATFVVVVIVIHFILSRLYLAFSANLGLLCMLHPGMEPVILTSLPKDGGVSCFGRSSGRSPIQFLTKYSHVDFS